MSNNRIYWYDGERLRWLDRNGSQGAEEFPVENPIGMEFAVSPDDTRIAVTLIDFNRVPLHRGTWIEDIGTRAHKTVLFDGDLTGANQTSSGWPGGWHGTDPVLYDYPLCVVLGGDQFLALNHPRVVDAASGRRLVSFPDCYGGTITTGGVLCTTSPSAPDNPFTATALTWLDWSGGQAQRWQLPYQTVACDSDLNPSLTTVLAYCQPNRYTQPAGADTRQREFVFGVGPRLPAAIANDHVRWLDNDHVLVPDATASGVAIWSLNTQKLVAGPLAVAGDFVGRLSTAA